MLNLSDLGPRSMNDLDHWYSFNHLVNSIYQLWYCWLQQFLKNPLFYPYKSIRDQNWPCHKIGHGRSTQGHHLNKSGSTWAPNAAYQLSRSSTFWFRRRRFFKAVPYMDMVTILVMWPGPFEQTFVPPSHWCSIWNLTMIGQAVSEEMFKECGWRQRRMGQQSLPML